MNRVSRIVFGGSFALALSTLGAGSVHAQDPAPAPVSPEAASQETLEVVVQLVAGEGAEGSGEATLRGTAEGQVEATVHVTQLPESTAWSAFLVSGSCTEAAEVIVPLGTIEVGAEGHGTASTAVASPLSDLLAGPATVQIHPQGEAPTQALLCGEVAPASGS